MDKKILIAIIIIVLIIIIAGVYFLFQNKSAPASQENTNQGNYEMIQGMKVEVLKEGTGVQAKSGDYVTVNYVGTLENGTKFDSSIDRGTPFPFTLGAGEVIKGWDLGVLGMRVGEKRKLTVPPELGYGNNAVGGVIPANSTLIFEVDMLEIGK